jgi:hypothetical protein
MAFLHRIEWPGSSVFISLSQDNKNVSILLHITVMTDIELNVLELRDLKFGELKIE